MSQSFSAEGLDKNMLAVLSKFWWVLLLRGSFAVAFGITAIVWPGLTLFTLIILFGAYAVVDGVLEIWNGLTNRSRHDRWWVDILIGLAGIVAGLLVMALPDVTARALMYFIAAWMIVIGVLQIITAIRVRKEIANEWLIVLSGAISVLLGLYFFAFPGGGAVSLVWLIGIYAIFFGAMLIMFAFRIRNKPAA